VRSTLAIEVEAGSLVRVGAELAVAGFFRDRRPLRGGAGLADWRLCGWLSGLVGAARLRGEWGEAALLLTQGRLLAPRVLLLGLGAHDRFGADAHRDAVRLAVERVADLGVGVVALDLPPPHGVEAPERIALGLLAGACEALAPRVGRMLLRIVTPVGQASNWRCAFEEAAAALPRSTTSIKILRPAGAAAAPAGLRGAGSGRSESQRG
jgi:hypothetical protein